MIKNSLEYKTLHIKEIAKICGSQDGAIFNNFLFRFGTRGECHVYDMNEIEKATDPFNASAIASFPLDKAELIVPHSNAVCFGNEFYASDDEFPLLYSNIYNNYANTENPLAGVCCVYRLQRSSNGFKSTLVQIIEIGFTDSTELWRSRLEPADVRPYGNFTIDPETSTLYAFTMRDAASSTRYFAFDLPKLSDGVFSERYGVKKVTLDIHDIKDQFDVEYHHYVQGACTHKGKIYSVEGFTNNEKNPPALRIINTKTKQQELCVMFADLGMSIEAEMIDFKNDVCYYSDVKGNLYIIEF